MTFYLRDYKTFDNRSQLNDAIRKHLYAHNFDLSDIDRAVFEFVSRHAVKYPGAAHLKAATIATAIDRSEKTVRRSLNKMQALGILRKIKVIREVSGGYGANIIVINPVNPTNASDQSSGSNREEAEEPSAASVEPVEVVVEANISLSQENIKNNKSHKDTVLGAEFLRGSIPDEIYNAMSPFFNAEELYNAYGALLRAKASVDRSLTIEEYATEFIDAFRAVIFAYKQGRVRKLNGCLFAAFKNAAIEIKRRVYATTGKFALFADLINA